MDYVSFGTGPKKLAVLPGLSDGLMTVRGKALLLCSPYRKHFADYTVYIFSRKNDLPMGTSIRDMAEDQAAALRACGVDRAAVLGVSQGGMIAQHLAAAHPELVEALVLAVTAPCLNDKTEACLRRWMELAERGDHRGLMTDTAEMSYSPAYLKRYRKLYPLLGLVGRPKSYDRFLANAQAILGFDARDELGRIACPTLILAGGEDRIVGREASEELRSRIPGSRLHVYEGLGHAAYEEAADFYDRVFRFLEEAERGPGADE